MPTINMRSRQIVLKIVYVGPGLGGKTTNIEQLHSHLPGDATTDLRLIKTEEDRTLFFDFFALDMPEIQGLKTRISVYGVPGQPYYRATRKAALAGADGLIFVADSQGERADANKAALQDIKALVAEHGLSFDRLPIVFQWNKRDLLDILPVRILNEMLNDREAPHFEATAIQNEGVVETFKQAVRLVTEQVAQSSAS